MASWVGVDLVPFIGIEVGSCLEQPGAEGHRLFMCRPWILDVQIEMDLLGSSMRPIGLDVIWRELDADAPRARAINHAVKSFVSVVDVPAENPSPERAFSRRVCGIEHDNLTYHFHNVGRYTGAERIIPAYRAKQPQLNWTGSVIFWMRYSINAAERTSDTE